MTSRSLLLLLAAASVLIPSGSGHAKEWTRFSVPDVKISRERFTELTADDETAVDQIFRNNTCMASFLPEEVARNVMKAALSDEFAATRAREDFKARDYTWKRNLQNQSYVPAYAVIAQIVRGILPTGIGLRDAFKKVSLSEVNAGILSHKRQFLSKVEELAVAGFRFQIDKMQQNTKLVIFGMGDDIEKINEMARQLKYATMNDNGETTYYDSAFFLAYLMETANLAAAAE